MLIINLVYFEQISEKGGSNPIFFANVHKLPHIYKKNCNGKFGNKGGGQMLFELFPEVYPFCWRLQMYDVFPSRKFWICIFWSCRAVGISVRNPIKRPVPVGATKHLKDIAITDVLKRSIPAIVSRSVTGKKSGVRSGRLWVWFQIKNQFSVCPFSLRWSNCCKLCQLSVSK